MSTPQNSHSRLSTTAALGMTLKLPMTRREALRVSLFSTAGLLLPYPPVLGADAPTTAVATVAGTAGPAGASETKAKAKSIIQIFLWGGMSHIDTWDPKPDAGRDYLGSLPKAIPTNVDGIQIGQLFPNLAKQADKFSFIRSLTHRNNGHETAAYLVQTAHAPGERLAYPSIGAVFALLKSADYKGLIPPYVVLTQPQGRFSEEGFLGPLYKPFATGGDPNSQRFEVEGVVAPGMTDDRQKSRQALLGKMNTFGDRVHDVAEISAAEDAKKRAYELILGAGKE